MGEDGRGQGDGNTTFGGDTNFGGPATPATPPPASQTASEAAAQETTSPGSPIGAPRSPGARGAVRKQQRFILLPMSQTMAENKTRERATVAIILRKLAHHLESEENSIWFLSNLDISTREDAAAKSELPIFVVNYECEWPAAVCVSHPRTPGGTAEWFGRINVGTEGGLTGILLPPRECESLVDTCTRYLELTNSFQITSCCRPPRAPHGPEIDSIARSMTPSTTFNATAHDLEEILVASRPSEVGPK